MLFAATHLGSPMKTPSTSNSEKILCRWAQMMDTKAATFPNAQK